MNNRGAGDVVYLHFYKGFDTVSCSIPMQPLIYGLGGWEVGLTCWLKGLCSMAQSSSGSLWLLMPLRDWCWCQYCLMCVLIKLSVLPASLQIIKLGTASHELQFRGTSQRSEKWGHHDESYEVWQKKVPSHVRWRIPVQKGQEGVFQLNRRRQLCRKGV